MCTPWFSIRGFLGSPEIVDTWGLGGPGGPKKHSERGAGGEAQVFVRAFNKPTCLVNLQAKTVYETISFVLCGPTSSARNNNQKQQSDSEADVDTTKSRKHDVNTGVFNTCFLLARKSSTRVVWAAPAAPKTTPNRQGRARSVYGAFALVFCSGPPS